MKYFKNGNTVYAFEDDDDESYYVDMHPISESQALEFVAATPSQQPSQCTPAQGLVALYALKNITEVDVLEAIASISDSVQRYTAQIGFNRAVTWDRYSPSMQVIAVLLGLTDEDLDALFAYAITVQT